jgi:hypothetical protein
MTAANTTDERLYAKDFGSRPLMALGGGLALTALVAGLAVRTHLLVLLAAPLFLAAGIAGFLRANTYLEVGPGRVTVRSRLRERTFAAADVTLERSFTSNAFVVARRGHARDAVCVFADDDIDDVFQAFAEAGVEIITPETSGTDGLAENGQGD